MFRSGLKLKGIIYFAFLIVVACDGAPTPPPQASEPTVERQSYPDPGPTRKRTIGQRLAQRYAEAQLVVDGITETTEAVYLRLPVPPPQQGIVLPDLRFASLSVKAQSYGVAVPAESGVIEDNPWLYVRFPRKEYIRGPFAIEAQIPATLTRVGGEIVLKVRMPAHLPQRQGLDQRFHRAAARWFGRRTGAFAGFATGRIRLMGGLVKSGAPGSPSFDVMNSTADPSLMAKLLRDRGEARKSHVRSERSDSVEIPEPMIPGGPRRPKVAVEPIGQMQDIMALVPNDALVFLGSSLRMGMSSVKHSRFWYDAATPLLPFSVEQMGFGTSGFKELKLHELATEGVDRAVSSFAIYSRNPALGTTADVTILLSGRERSDLRKAVSHWVAGATEDQGIWRSQNRFFGWSGSILVISNQEKSARAALRTPKYALGQDQMFWWHLRRSLNEDGGVDPTLFLGYAALAHFFSPKARVGFARSQVARSELLAVDLSRTLFKWLNGRFPRSNAESLRVGTLRKDDLIHGDGRGPIENAVEARSAWGDHRRLVASQRPMELGTVEALGYERFRERWRGIIRHSLRPFSVRLAANETGGRVVVTTSGIGVGSSLSQLFDYVNSVSIPRLSLSGGIAGQFSLLQGSGARRRLVDSLRSMSGRRDAGLDWAGDWVILGVLNRASLWDAVLDLAGVPSRTVTQDAEHLALRKKTMSSLPAFAVIPIKRVKSFDRFRRLLKAGVSDALSGALNWAVEPSYGDVRMIRVTETLSSAESRLGATLAFDEKFLIVAPNRQTAELVWNKIKDGGLAKPKLLAARIHFELGMVPWLRKSIAGVHLGAAFPRMMHQSSGVEIEDLLAGRSVDRTYGRRHAPTFPPLPTAKTPIGTLLGLVSSATLEFKGRHDDRALAVQLSWTVPKK